MVQGITVLIIGDDNLTRYALYSLLSRHARIGPIFGVGDISDLEGVQDAISQCMQNEADPECAELVILYDVDNVIEFHTDQRHLYSAGMQDRSGPVCPQEFYLSGSELFGLHDNLYQYVEKLKQIRSLSADFAPLLFVCKDPDDIARFAIDSLQSSVVSKAEMCHLVGEAVTKTAERYLVVTNDVIRKNRQLVASIELSSSPFSRGAYYLTLSEGNNVKRCPCLKLKAVDAAGNDHLWETALLYCIEGLSRGEVASRLDITEQAIYPRLDRIIEELEIEIPDKPSKRARDEKKRLIRDVLLGVNKPDGAPI